MDGRFHAGRYKMDFAETCSSGILIGNLVRPSLSLYRTELREHGYGLWAWLAGSRCGPERLLGRWFKKCCNINL
jgi:hypothetical protein